MTEKKSGKIGLDDPRNIALEVLTLMDKEPAASHKALKQALDKYAYLEKTQRAFISVLVRGVTEKRIELDYIINNFSNTKVNKQKPYIRNILRMAAYQIKYMDSVPDSAACNEAVKLANLHHFMNLKGFVNGVLRTVAREYKNIAYPDRDKDFVSYLSLKYSFPEWLIRHYIAYLGQEKIEEVLDGFDEKRSIDIRTNTSKISPKDLLARLEAEGLKACLIGEEAELVKRADELGLKIPDYAIRILKVDRLDGLETFAEGLFEVQDLSSMMAGEGGLIKKDAKILDLCAAPGGKSINAALIASQGHVTSCDLTFDKTDLIRENVERLGLTNIDIMEADAREDNFEADSYDLVIADLPCSGLGICGRKPDIKYNIKEEDLKSLASLQRQILDRAVKYVKPGGYLIYSTCTLNWDENEANVAYILDKQDVTYSKVEDELRILPSKGFQDGFFIARLKREA